jgi:methyltransferase
VTPAICLLSFVTLQRVVELILARRNTRKLLARGAFEAARGHYPLIVAAQASWLAGLWLLGWDAELRLGWLLAFAVLQFMRAWVIATLGRRWTTRILVVPGAPLVRNGPYRFLSHPNYAVVAGEIAVVPLALGLAWYALAFSIVNAAVLAIRIKAENAAILHSP